MSFLSQDCQNSRAGTIHVKLRGLGFGLPETHNGGNPISKSLHNLESSKIKSRAAGYIPTSTLSLHMMRTNILDVGRGTYSNHHKPTGSDTSTSSKSKTKLYLHNGKRRIHPQNTNNRRSRTYTQTHSTESRTSTKLLQATSSEDIKAAAALRKKRGRPKKKRRKTRITTEREVTAGGTSAARLSRAVAKASAKRGDGSSTGGVPKMKGRRVRKVDRTVSQNNPRTGSAIGSQSHAAEPSHLHSQSGISTPSHPKPSQASLTQLTRVIDSQLYANGPRGTTRGDYPEIDGVVQNARDNMISLLGFNQKKGDWKIHSSTSTFNVAIVFGKKLVRDQVTVEYASRIRTLARMFKNEPEFRPSLVCFCGGVAEGSHVANSDAGYIFFRHMCEAQGIDLGGVAVFIDNKSQNDAEAVKYVTDAVKEQYVPRWLDFSPTITELNQKSIDVHFTLVSTEYHLCNINDVHHRSPEQSLMQSMEYMDGVFHEHKHCISDSQQYQDKLSKKELTQAMVKISWSFQYATYPYIYAKNDSIVFLGKCFLLGEELLPLLVNMQAVVEQREFFQRDNYLMLASIRRSLVQHIEALHKPSHSRKKILNKELRRIKDIHGMERDVITILEGALLSLGRCVDLVKPAALHAGSVSKEDWKRALKALEHSMHQISSFCDPDRPLLPSEWGKLVDGEDKL